MGLSRSRTLFSPPTNTHEPTGSQVEFVTNTPTHTRAHTNKHTPQVDPQVNFFAKRIHVHQSDMYWLIARMAALKAAASAAPDPTAAAADAPRVAACEWVQENVER